MLNWALKYRKMGLSVIPLKPKEKKPLVAWEEFQKRLASEEEIRKWWSAAPNANIGIVTGRISYLAVIDLDGPLGLSNGTKLNLKSTLTSITGNGKQLFYQWNEGICNSASQIAEKIDVRGEGGYIVAPPSIHPNGKRYRFVGVLRLATLPLFPQRLLSVSDVEKPESKEEDWVSDALEEMKNGHIHNTLVSILGKFRYHNFSVSDTVALLKPYAYENGKPFEGLEEKVKEIWGRYEPKAENLLRNGSMYGQGAGFDPLLSIKSPTNDGDFEQFTLSRQANVNDESIKTGFPTMDRYFEGGLKSERLFTVAARTGTGKTNFAIALAANLCSQGKKVLFFSTEFRYDKIWSRYQPYLKSGLQEFRGHSLYVCDSFTPNIGQVEEAIKQVMPDVWIFDHINHIGEEREGLGVFMQGANFLQRKYNNQGVMVAQLNRQADWVEEGKRIEPRMSMIKGSGTIEQASSRVLLLSEIRITPEFNEVLGVLDKNDSGDRGTISFGLYKNPYHFGELQ